MEKEFTDDTILARWLSSDLTKEEEIALEKQIDLKALGEVVDQTDNFTYPVFDKSAMWEELMPKMAKVNKTEEIKKAVVPIKSLRRRRWIGAAASIALLLGVAYFVFYDAPTRLVADAGTRQTFQLPNGSELILNAGSVAVYYKKEWTQKRVVELEGEGYFKVTKGNNFLVKIPEGEVEVLGTEFNVQSRSGIAMVQCYEGRVAVRVVNENVQEAILTQNQKVQIQNRKLSKVETHEDQQPPWLDNKLRFEASQLIDVFAELERQYNLKINFPTSIAERVYSGTVPSNNLELALKFVCESMGLVIEKQTTREIDIQPKKLE